MTSQSDIAGIQMARGVPPFRFLAYGKTGEVLLLRNNIKRPTSLTIPKDISKRVARTILRDARGQVVNVWDAPWEVDD